MVVGEKWQVIMKVAVVLDQPVVTCNVLGWASNHVPSEPGPDKGLKLAQVQFQSH